MQMIPTEIPDILIFKPRIFSDERGGFLELFRQDELLRAGIPPFVQENQSFSWRGVLRGLHYQIIHPQGKLVRVVAGEIYDVAVDLRRSSPTFGKSFGIVLKAADREQLWIPVGFAHGFYVLSSVAEVIYKTTDSYAPNGERTLYWDDPDLQISWPIPVDQPPLLSAKDVAGRRLRDLLPEDLFD